MTHKWVLIASFFCITSHKCYRFDKLCKRTFCVMVNQVLSGLLQIKLSSECQEYFLRDCLLKFICCKKEVFVSNTYLDRVAVFPRQFQISNFYCLGFYINRKWTSNYKIQYSLLMNLFQNWEKYSDVKGKN